MARNKLKKKLKKIDVDRVGKMFGAFVGKHPIQNRNKNILSHHESTLTAPLMSDYSTTTRLMNNVNHNRESKHICENRSLAQLPLIIKTVN